MKRMTITLSAVAGLAAATVAMAAPAAAVRYEVGAAPLRQCIVIDPAAAGANHEADRYSAMQVVPTSC